MFPWQSARVWDTAPGLPHWVSLLNHRQELRIPGSQVTGRTDWRTELVPSGIIAVLTSDLWKWNTLNTMGIEKGGQKEGGRQRDRLTACFNEERLVTYITPSCKLINLTAFICTISEQKLKSGNILYTGPLFITLKGQNKKYFKK